MTNKITDIIKDIDKPLKETKNIKKMLPKWELYFIGWMVLKNKLEEANKNEYVMIADLLNFMDKVEEERKKESENA